MFQKKNFYCCLAVSGITQEDIDEERLATERQMLADVEWFHKNGQSLDFRDENGATLVSE